jgi:hypothetical protein
MGKGETVIAPPQDNAWTERIETSDLRPEVAAQINAVIEGLSLKIDGHPELEAVDSEQELEWSFSLPKGDGNIPTLVKRRGHLMENGMASTVVFHFYPDQIVVKSAALSLGRELPELERRPKNGMSLIDRLVIPSLERASEILSPL